MGWSSRSSLWLEGVLPPRVRLGLALLALPMLACATAPPRSELMKTVGASDMKPEELRIKVRALAGRFSGLLEELADDLIVQGGDMRTRFAMTRFKSNAIPAMQASLFQPDPVAALVDAWALLAQMDQWVVRNAARDPKAAALVRERFATMTGEVEQVWRELTGKEDTSATRRQVEAWAGEHPLTASLASREGTAPLLASVTARSGVSPLGAAGVVLNDTQDLMSRLDVQSTFLPKEVRWQAEHMLLEVMTDPTFRPDVPEARALLVSLDDATRMAADLPEIVRRERVAVLAAFRQERIATFDFLSAERERALADLRGAQEALTADLRAEREAAFEDAQRVGDATIDHAFDRVDGLVSRTVLAVGLLLAAFLVVQVVLIALFVRWLRRSGRPA